MKFFSYRTFAFICLVIAIALSLMTSKNKAPSSFKKNHLAVAAPHAVFSTSNQLVPAAMDQPSAEELKEFPGATVVEAAEVDGPEPGEKTELRILKTHFKYPFIRTEEIIDRENNSVLLHQEMVADHFLVTLAEGENPKKFLKELGAQATAITRVTQAAPLYRVNLASASLEALPALLDQTRLATAGTGEPDFIIHAAMVPNNKYFNLQWALQNAYIWNNDQHIYYGTDAVDAWDIRMDASSVIVAIIDSGIRYTHESLAANIWHNPTVSPDEDLHGWNAYADNGDPMDDNGHGTFCAGIIGAVGNDHFGICGVAWKVQLMACKFMDNNGNGASSDEVVCIDYAINHGATILNCSFTSPSFSEAEFEALNRAGLKGAIVTVAAGNYSKNNDLTPAYPAYYYLDNIVTVAALSQNNNLSSYSNYGPTTVHLAAPGDAIYSTWGGSSDGIGATVDGSANSAYTYGSGTSFAAPHVAGAFALLQAEFPNESYQSLIARLLAGTRKLPELEGITISGGCLDIATALTGPAPKLPWQWYDLNRTWTEWWKSL